MKFKFLDNNISETIDDMVDFRNLIEEHRYNYLHTNRTDKSYTSLRRDVFCYIERFDFPYDSLDEQGIETLKSDMLSKLIINIHPDIELEGHNGILYDVIFQDDNSFTYRIEMLQ